MDRAEAAGILSVLKAAYPVFYRGMDKRDAENAVNLWLDMFRDDSSAEVGLAVKAFIDQDGKGFPPTPGQIREKIPKRKQAISGPANNDPDWSELLRRHAELIDRRRADGLPGTLEEAKKAGMNAVEWCMTLDKAGLSVEEVFQ